MLHTWVNATCTTLKTCEICGVTEGKVLGHTWGDATCTTPKTCKVCGTTEGKLGHKWKSATYSTPKTCNICGEIDGVAMKEWRWDGSPDIERLKYPYVTETDLDEILSILKEYNPNYDNFQWSDMSEADKLDKAQSLLNSCRFSDPEMPATPKPAKGYNYKRVEESTENIEWEFKYLIKLLEKYYARSVKIVDLYTTSNKVLEGAGYFKLIIYMGGDSYKYIDIKVDSSVDIGFIRYKDAWTDFNTVASHEQYYYK